MKKQTKHKQKLRAKRRRIRRHNKRINFIYTALCNLPMLTQSFYKIGTSWHQAIIHMSDSTSNLVETINDWKASLALTNPSFLSAPNYMLQSQAVAMSKSNVGSDLVKRHQPDFSQLVIHPDPLVTHFPPEGPAPLKNIIMDLNDNCGWTREQIANWLDTLDNQPTFYPNTCPDDCQEECCKPPTPTFFTDKITADTISSNKILALPDVSYSYEIVDYDSINAYGFEDKFSDNCTYKGSITISNEWKMQQTPETLDLLHTFTQYFGVAYSYDFLENSTTYHKEGSQAEVKSALYTVQQFLKGNIDELPAQPCTCYFVGCQWTPGCSTCGYTTG